MSPPPFGPRAMPAARKPRMLDTPRRLHIGATTAIVPRRHRALDFAPLMYVDNPERSADTMLDDEEEEDAAAAVIPSTEPTRGI